MALQLQVKLKKLQEEIDQLKDHCQHVEGELDDTKVYYVQSHTGAMYIYMMHFHMYMCVLWHVKYAARVKLLWNS